LRMQSFEAMNSLQRWVYNNGNTCRDLLKNFIYLLMHSNKLQLADARGRRLPPGTQISMLSKPFNFGIYWRRLKLKLVLRYYLGDLIRKLPGGANLLRVLKRLTQNPTRA